ncbi:MAG: protein meaA, partial [Beijerinckiaceae bacterium]
PMNVCSYHLQEAGATPVQELSYALANAVAVLDAVKATGQVTGDAFEDVVGRISFFVNAGMRFVTEIAKLRAFVDLWEEITRDRYGVKNPKHRMFRYGVQVNSLGLTEQQPENNVYRILIEMLAVTLSKKARARAVQLPAWNEALGLPRPFDQQWSLRMQQILAYETDLLEYGDLFDGSAVMDKKVEELKDAARAELKRLDETGGAVAAIEAGTMKRALVASNAERLGRIERGEQVVVGVNSWTETEESPLTAGDGSILTVSDNVEADAVRAIKAWRAGRNGDAVRENLARLEAAARGAENIMEASIACAKVGITTGEWGETLRGVFGQYRAPTGVTTETRPTDDELKSLQAMVAALEKKLGTPVSFLVGKPGLDGHSNGAEQIALRAIDAGMSVIYDGIRQTPDEIVEKAKAEKPHVIGLSILSGSHVPLVRAVVNRLRREGLDIPVVVGGIIPPDDENVLRNIGVAAVYTPKDFKVNDILGDVTQIIGKRATTKVA